MLLAKASAINAPLSGHQRYTVAFPTWARSAISSIVKSANPVSLRSLKVVCSIARRAFSLRGRPGGRFPFPFSLYDAAVHLWRMILNYHIIQSMYLESDTHSIE